jgi:hypothetical protein
MQKNSKRKAWVKHGAAGSPVYQAWSTMLRRCENPRNPSFRNYGGRGITVCDEWHDFVNFYRDMGARPDGCTLERIDNDKGYSKENCRWATRLEQASNTRKNRWISANGKRLTVSQWAREMGVPANVIGQRLYRGWDEVRAVTEPPYSTKFSKRGSAPLPAEKGV